MDKPSGLTVKEAAERTLLSEQSVRRLIKSGKFTSTPEGKKLLIDPASVQAYLEVQPHPPVYMAALRMCQQVLGRSKRLEMYRPTMKLKDTLYPADTYAGYLERSKPYMEALIISLKAKDYEKADRARASLWQETEQYERLNARAKGEVYAPEEPPEWIRDMLRQHRTVN